MTNSLINKPILLLVSTIIATNSFAWDAEVRDATSYAFINVYSNACGSNSDSNSDSAAATGNDGTCKWVQYENGQKTDSNSVHNEGKSFGSDTTMIQFKFNGKYAKVYSDSTGTWKQGTRNYDTEVVCQLKGKDGATVAGYELFASDFKFISKNDVKAMYGPGDPRTFKPQPITNVIKLFTKQGVMPSPSSPGFIRNILKQSKVPKHDAKILSLQDYYPANNVNRITDYNTTFMCFYGRTADRNYARNKDNDHYYMMYFYDANDNKLSSVSGDKKFKVGSSKTIVFPKLIGAASTVNICKEDNSDKCNTYAIDSSFVTDNKYTHYDSNWKVKKASGEYTSGLYIYIDD